MASAEVEREQRRRTDLASLRIDRNAAPRRAGGDSPRRGGRIWIAVAAVVAVGLAALWLASGRAVPVTVAHATRSTPGSAGPAPMLSGSGYVVTGDRYVSIGVRVAGRIDRYFIEEGQSVKKGDPLVQLDDRDYRAAVTRTEANLALARANLELAQAELRRGRSLRSSGVISEQELDVLENKGRVARSSVNQITADLEQAQVSLEYTVLRAPTDGVILAKLKEVGEIAVPGGFAGSGDLVRLANLSDIRAEVDVNEADLARVRIGGPALVTPDAYPDRHYDAQVVKLYPQVNRQKGTLKVEVRVLKPDEKLLPDMSARITFLADPGAEEKSHDATEVVFIPTAALQRDTQGAFVWVVADGRVRRASIETAGDVGDRVRVVRGLSGGEAVVVGEAQLHEGQQVKIAGRD